MCEPDPACTRAKSSSSSPTCHRRRRLRGQQPRLRRFHHLRSRRTVEWTPAEEWTSTRVPTALPSPRTRLRRPRRPYAHRAHLRKGGTSSVIAFTAPYVRWPKIKLVVRVAFKTSMHASMLARAGHGRLDGILLLLTSLEVRARPAPRAAHHCHPPLQQKLWRELNCS